MNQFTANQALSGLTNHELRRGRSSQSSYLNGIITSLLLHVLSAILTVVILERNARNVVRPLEVFSVTLEGGEVLGGIGQVPKEGAKKILTQAASEDPGHSVVPDEPTETATSKTEEKQEKAEKLLAEKRPEKDLTVPSAVDDPEKILAAKKLAEQKKLDEQRKAEEKKKKLEEDKKKKAEEEKKAKEEEENKKKAEADKKKQDEAKKAELEKQKTDRQQRDKQLADRLRKIQQRYDGESADAGGKGFGAAALGGKGMGGGTLASAEKLAYQNALLAHVKGGWRWLGGTEVLITKVEAKILQDGRVQDVSVIQSSGNRNFDDSAVRAVFKASPVPPAPAHLYAEFFATVTFTFDSSKMQ